MKTYMPDDAQYVQGKSSAVGLHAVNERLDEISGRLGGITERAQVIHNRLYGPQPEAPRDRPEYGAGTMQSLAAIEEQISTIERTLSEI